MNARQGRTVTPLQLVKAKPNLDTIKALESLLAGARIGEVTGMAFACSLKNMRYVTDTVGFCYEHPTFARGMVALLSDELAALAHSRNEDEIR